MACGPREITWSSEAVEYTKRADDDSVDERILPEITRHRADFYHYFSAPPAQAPVRYHKFLDRKDFQRRAHCSLTSSGCFFRRWGVESRQPMDVHELIHAYTEHWGDKPKLVEEGLAQAMSCSRSFSRPALVALDVAWEPASWNSPSVREVEKLYYTGGAFVTYLLEVYEPRALHDFYIELNAADDLVAVRSKFEAAFGAELDQVWRNLEPRTDKNPCASWGSATGNARERPLGPSTTAGLQ